MLSRVRYVTLFVAVTLLSLLSNQALANNFYAKNTPPVLVESEIVELIKNIPDMKVRMYRDSPEAVLLDIQRVINHSQTAKHTEIFEAIIRFFYSTQALPYQNKSTKAAYYKTKHFIDKFNRNSAKTDFALSELMEITRVYETKDFDYLVNIIEDKSYPLPIFQFFAKYIYVSFSPDITGEKYQTYLSDLNRDAFEKWKKRLPENIVDNPNSIAEIEAALYSEEENYFDFIHYFNLLHYSRQKNSKNGVFLTDDDISLYIDVLSKKYVNKFYFLNNFRVWFLSVMKPGYSEEKTLELYNAILHTGLDQQKGIAFEYFAYQMSVLNALVPQSYLKQVNQLIKRLKAENDYYALRGIAIGYLNLDDTYKENAHELLKYIYYKCDNALLKIQIKSDLDRFFADSIS